MLLRRQEAVVTDAGVARRLLDVPRASLHGLRELAHTAAIAALAVACTPFEPGTDELGAEAAELQPAEPGRDWSCLGSVRGRPRNILPIAMGASRLVQSIQILSLVTGSTIPGVSVRACPQRDVECASPLTELEPVRSDGWIDVVLYEGFSGFLEIQGDAIVPMALFFSEPLTLGLQAYPTPVSVVEKAVLPSLTGAIGTRQDPTLGLVVLRTLDCQGEGALGVSYDIDRAGAPWYFVAGLPSSAVQETADSGLGGFINVMPGVAVVSGELEGRALAIMPPTSILVRAGWMTGIRFVPSDPE
jgi:hypothetical protein